MPDKVAAKLMEGGCYPSNHLYRNLMCTKLNVHCHSSIYCNSIISCQPHYHSHFHYHCHYQLSNKTTYHMGLDPLRSGGYQGGGRARYSISEYFVNTSLSITGERNTEQSTELPVLAGRRFEAETDHVAMTIYTRM